MKRSVYVVLLFLTLIYLVGFVIGQLITNAVKPHAANRISAESKKPQVQSTPLATELKELIRKSRSGQ